MKKCLIKSMVLLFSISVITATLAGCSKRQKTAAGIGIGAGAGYALTKSPAGVVAGGAAGYLVTR